MRCVFMDKTNLVNVKRDLDLHFKEMFTMFFCFEWNAGVEKKMLKLFAF